MQMCVSDTHTERDRETAEKHGQRENDLQQFVRAKMLHDHDTVRGIEEEQLREVCFRELHELQSGVGLESNALGGQFCILAWKEGKGEERRGTGEKGG